MTGGTVLPAGSITWATGALGKGKNKKPVWKWIAPPYTQDKPYTLTAPPMGALRTNSRIPSETIQMIGEPDARVPRRITVDQGIVDILVSEGGKHIEFTGGGLKTDVGARIPSTTEGLSIEDGGDYLEDDFAGLSRIDEAKVDRRITKRTKRPAKRLSEYDRMTTLKGFRVL
jgi:hypothetical protein